MYQYILLCSLQTRLRPLPVQTQGMQLLKLFIQIYYINSHQQYEMSQLRYHTVQCSKITIVVKHIIYKRQQEQLGQLYCNWL